MVGGAVNPSLQATAEGGAQAAPAHAADSGAAPDTVQSLQHEIEVIKAKIAQEREKIRVSKTVSSWWGNY